MKTTSTTQHPLLKNLLSLTVFIVSLICSQSLIAQTGQRCFTGPNVACATCLVGYPDNSNLPRSAVAFNESEVLRAADPGPSTCGAAPAQIKVWYSDEHALTLGIRRVIVKSSGGTTTTDYPITPTPSSPTCVVNPLVGSTIASGDQAGNDVAGGGGRPMWPALFITDLTVNGPSSRAGDWQYGGTAIPPHKVCGTWKGAVRTVDNTKSPATVTITPDSDPAKNNWNLGGGDAPPAGTTDQGYGAEVVWNVASLGLIAGHTYRLQFMVHDGDQNKTGGDVGESCTIIVMPGGVVNPPTVTATSTWTSNAANQTVTIRTTLSKTFVDNTYGTNAIGWPSPGHTFADLLNSDNLRLALYDASGALKMDFAMDYFSASSAAPSGYKSLGVSGGDGHLYTGNSSNIVSVRTSMDSNFNSVGYVLTANSPSTNSNYTPNPTYPAWDYNVWYEVTVKASAFGAAGFGYPAIPLVHASPSKTGTTELALDPINCPNNTVTLGNLVWDDQNNNGIHEISEPGFYGATVRLYLDADNNNVPDSPTPIATTVTDANGFYQFSGLAANNYIVGVVLPYNVSAVLTNGGDPDNNVDNDNNGVSVVNGEVRTLSVTLQAGTEPVTDGDNADANQTVDFALITNYGAFGDYVWDDINQNGRQDVNEPGLQNVIVKLYTCAGNLVSTTATDEIGEYIFINVPATAAGTSYKLVFSNLPQGYVFTTKNKAGVPGDVNSDADVAGITSCFVLHAGEANMDVDAGAYHAGGPTPVTLAVFQGSYSGGISKLNWKTTNEVSFDHYEIQRSTDATNFVTIGKVNAVGGTGANYNFNDVEPAKGANYYRLKIVDRDGNFRYTNIIMLNAIVKGLSINSVYPDPFTDKLTVNIGSEISERVQLKLTDYTGKTMYSEIKEIHTGTNNVTIDNLGTLAKGLYLLKVKVGEETKIAKVVKN